MKIVHLNTFQYGGAAIAACRLHTGLLQIGVDSSLLSLTGSHAPENQIFSAQASLSIPHFTTKMRLSKSLEYLNAWRVRLHSKPVELFSFPEALWKLEEHPLVKAADIIHLHWVAGMIDIPTFFSRIKKPVVWTFHDAWPFTGGFHYQSYFDCRPFAKLVRSNFNKLQRAYTGAKIQIISPSNYLLSLAESSGLFPDSCFTLIRNGVPTGTFGESGDKTILAKYGISTSDVCWFFSSGELDYYRKGADLLLSAFSGFKDTNIKLLMAGEQRGIRTKDDRVRFTGRIGSEKEMASLISASNLTLHTSREDNFPNTIVESLACGTPVLALARGGVEEMILHGKNGWLVESDSEAFLRNAFQEVHGKSFERKQISEDALRNFSICKQVEKTIEVYKQSI